MRFASLPFPSGLTRVFLVEAYLELLGALRKNEVNKIVEGAVVLHRIGGADNGSKCLVVVKGTARDLYLTVKHLRLVVAYKALGDITLAYIVKLVLKINGVALEGEGALEALELLDAVCTRHILSKYAILDLYVLCGEALAGLLIVAVDDGNVMTSGAGLDKCVSLGTEILTAVSSCTGIDKELLAVLCEDEGAYVVVVVELAVVTCLSRKAVLGSLFYEPLGVLGVVGYLLNGTVGVVVGVLVEPEEGAKEYAVSSTAVAVVAERGIVYKHITRILGLESMHQTEVVGKTAVTVCKAYAGLAVKEHLLNEGAYGLDKRSLKVVDSAVGKASYHIGIYCEEAEAVVPVAYALKADAILLKS